MQVAVAARAERSHTSIAPYPGLMALVVICTMECQSYMLVVLNLLMLDRLRQYLKELADAEREASRLVREHGSKARQVIAADIEVARKQGDAPAVRRLTRVASAIAAIEESPAALLHH